MGGEKDMHRKRAPDRAQYGMARSSKRFKALHCMTTVSLIVTEKGTVSDEFVVKGGCCT